MVSSSPAASRWRKNRPDNRDARKDPLPGGGVAGKTGHIQVEGGLRKKGSKDLRRLKLQDNHLLAHVHTRLSQCRPDALKRCFTHSAVMTLAEKQEFEGGVGLGQAHPQGVIGRNELEGIAGHQGHRTVIGKVGG